MPARNEVCIALAACRELLLLTSDLLGEQTSKSGMLYFLLGTAVVLP